MTLFVNLELPSVMSMIQPIELSLLGHDHYKSPAVGSILIS